MDLRSGYPFWLLEHGIIASFPSLENNLSADVTIIGAGISGALVAWYLRGTDLKVVVVDKRHVGMGSTAATTGLLQYEIDTPLFKLQKMVGEQNANKSYTLCLQAIDKLEKIAGQIPSCEFIKRPSLQFASFKKDVNDLKNEFSFRNKLGIDISFLSEKEIERLFGFKKEAALFSEKGGEVNAYAMTHGILRKCQRKNAEVYDHTEISKITRSKKGFELMTCEHKKIKTRNLVIACGYESDKYLPKKVDQLHSTYAIVSEPVPKEKFWHRRSLIWETADPYLYIRTTHDNRILVGGKDDDFTGSFKRDSVLNRKIRMLEDAFAKLFPQVPFKTDFSWSGLFGSTKDGLPYIGSMRKRKDLYFALGFGGNGIIFSVIAAEIIRDNILGKPNKNAHLFDFSR